MVFWANFSGLLGLFSVILPYIRQFFVIFKYFTLFCVILHYFTLIFDSMISYLRRALRGSQKGPGGR